MSKDNKSAKKETGLSITHKKDEDFANWYTDVLKSSELIDYYDISGCYILRPWSYSIWEEIQNFLNGKITASGVKNAYFPMFVSKSALEREKEHVEGFAPEVAWVTKNGTSDLPDPIAIRPTSETIIYPSYARWIRSHRDLPMRLNQWTNVVRWEFKHPTPFLRTREFLWQEGHSAFVTKEEADKEVIEILDYYASVYEELLAVPVIKGRKSEKEKFAGGLYTTTVEAFIPTNGRAIQGATSHSLGQNFAKMFNITFSDEDGTMRMPWQNSWGLTTRTIGVMIMVHGDNIGLVLPPRVAPVQVIFVPIFKAKESEEETKAIDDKCKELCDELKKVGIRAEMDLRINYTAGWKYNHWEQKGVPIRVEIGGRDMKNHTVLVSRRDIPTKEGKISIAWDKFVDGISNLLNEIQESLLDKARRVRDEHIVHVEKWEDFIPALDKKNLVLAPWCERIECEEEVKEKTQNSTTPETTTTNTTENNEEGQGEDGEFSQPALSGAAKTLCIPFAQEPLLPGTKCFSCGRDATTHALWGRSY